MPGMLNTNDYWTSISDSTDLLPEGSEIPNSLQCSEIPHKHEMPVVEEKPEVFSFYHSPQCNNGINYWREEIKSSEYD